jgi:hypothetical protein
MFGVEKRVRREDGNKPNKKETEWNVFLMHSNYQKMENK